MRFRAIYLNDRLIPEYPNCNIDRLICHCNLGRINDDVWTILGVRRCSQGCGLEQPTRLKSHYEKSANQKSPCCSRGGAQEVIWAHSVSDGTQKSQRKKGYRKTLYLWRSPSTLSRLSCSEVIFRWTDVGLRTYPHYENLLNSFLLENWLQQSGD